MKLLATGAGGLLGGNTQINLQDRLEFVPAPPSSLLDLSDPDASIDYLDTVKPDAIVNFAAFASVDGCDKDPNKAYRRNVLLVQHLAAWCNSNGAHLIHVSTDHVYDDPMESDEAAVRIVNHYAMSKYAGELAATGTATVLRTNFFGRSLTTRKSFSDWIVSSLTEGNQITVFTDVLFSPVSMRTLADIICLVLERPRYGIFNVGSRGGMSKADFAFLLAESAGLPIHLMTRGPAGQHFDVARPKDMRMNSDKFEDEFKTRLPSLADEVLAEAEHYRRSL